MPAGGAITLGAIGLGKAVVGLINSGKAKREAARLAASRPKYKESADAQDALKLANSELSTGIGGEAKNAYEQGIDRSLSTSLDTVLKGGGSANNVATIFDASTVGRQRLALMKSNVRLNQVNNIVRAQEFHTDQREKAFQFNDWAPWADQSKANAGARQAADDQIWSGVETAGSAVIKGVGAKRAKTEMDQYLAGPTNSAGPAPPGTGNTLPDRAQTGGSVSSPAASASPFVSPNIQPLQFNNMPSFNTPDISMQE